MIESFIIFTITVAAAFAAGAIWIALLVGLIFVIRAIWNSFKKPQGWKGL